VPRLVAIFVHCSTITLIAYMIGIGLVIPGNVTPTNWAVHVGMTLFETIVHPILRPRWRSFVVVSGPV